VANPFPDTDHNNAFSVTGTLSFFPEEFFELLQEDTRTAKISNHLNFIG